MNGNDFNKQLEALKRQFVDLVNDLHARKLAIPAAALLAAIVAAVVLLPKGAAPPPAPSTAALTPAVEQKVEQVAQISMIKPSKLGDEVVLSESGNPFSAAPGAGYDCTTVSTNPKVVDCLVSDTLIRIFCGEDDSNAACQDAKGASASTGKSGDGGGSTGGGGSGDIPPEDGGNTGGGSTGGGGGETTYFKYVAKIKLDGTEYKDVDSNTELPKSSSPLFAYLNPSSDLESATFIAAQGVTVSGVPIDPIFQAFILDVGQTVTLTDPEGKDHKLTLKGLKMVEIEK